MTEIPGNEEPLRKMHPAAGLSLAACGGSSSSPTGASAQISPGSATSTQICQAAAGTTSRGITVESATANTIYNNPNTIPTVNASGDVMVNCVAVASDGTQMTMNVTLFPNGSVGWYKNL